ncbi:tumor necrosis factor receptor superfamily member 5-like [Neoarius graeffei]|uniref:tumor necrosis factor receptor superfamily member 5-like n=1 Tax=Neoarius graeffei TaxID=443677 RepID=UPI00298D06BA|nr:tumor necrosis factor receptor superfamily member 5-like [Neoarius graeffei]
MRRLLAMSCPEGQYEHKGSCCKKCPKGTHMSPSDCNQCEPCPDGYYTAIENSLDNCLQCQLCDSKCHLEISKSCTAESNGTCKCMKGFYCTGHIFQNGDHHCTECKPVHLCPPGKGVSFHPNSTHDTVCEPCPAGTFNNWTDSSTTCQTHTSCSAAGRYLISDGTAETDAKCGDFVSRCHWMIPASLWAGLILTLILMVIGVICLKSKRKRKAVITLVSSENFVSPGLPPDIIKCPGSSEMHALTHNNKICAEEDEDAFECDSVSVKVFSEKFGAFSIPDTSFTSEPYRSEPQEDDWPGL